MKKEHEPASGNYATGYAESKIPQSIQEKNKKSHKYLTTDNKRNFIQLAAAVLMNGFITGFRTGKIFKGSTKSICVPVLNCYSCPGALGACPIGSLQSILCGHKYKISFYILGYLMLFGIILGRGVCGFLCPFGMIQGLLYKIPFIKRDLPGKADRKLRYLKYAVLLVLVILLPLFLKDQYGIGTTYFCKYLCPAGTLEAGIPMLLLNSDLKTAIGTLFYWKFAILAVILVLCLAIYRPFCKYLCPLGAFYALFNRFSFFQLKLDEEKCVGCGKCEKTCPMKVDVRRETGSAECIRCGKCADVCPAEALSVKFDIKNEK